MNKLIFLFLGFFLATISFGQTNQTDAQGKKQGEWIKKYPNSSVIMYQGTFKNDKPVGTFTYNYKSNKVKAIVKHNATSTRSEAFFYHENGKLMTHGIYKNQKKDSIWVSYNEQGRLTMSETYKNDLLNGEKKLYYLPHDPSDKSEIVISVYNYVNGQVDGKFIEYYPSKVVRKTGQFKNFKRHGEWIQYEINGNKLIVEHYWEGKQHGWFIGYDEKGQEGQRQYYNYGTLVEGEKLKKLLQEKKDKGINPNGG